MTDAKMADHHNCIGHEIAWRENAGHENDGPKMTAGCEIADEKNTVLTEVTLQWSVQCFVVIFVNF